MPTKKFISGLVILTLLGISVLPGCLRKKAEQRVKNEVITLTFYGLFDNEDLYLPAIRTFESAHAGVSVIYKKFTEPETYLQLIVNELAEGEGPDVFMLHNTWFPNNYKKLNPAPSSVVTPEAFRSAFVEVAANDMIIPDSAGTEKIYGLPAYVDTLALFYNKSQLEEAVPERGRPGDTWDEVMQAVIKLNKQDNSYERFERSGIAMGRGDNILRAFDILTLLFLQYKVNFYSEDLKNVTLANDSNALTALSLYTNFGKADNGLYSWNKYLADADGAEKEISTFARGKVAMIFGYSFTYEDILNEISRLQSLGEDTIDSKEIKIQEVPQPFDPETSTETKKTYASYFAPVVGRTSQHPDLAWEFIATLISAQNEQFMNGKTHRPSGRRILIAAESEDQIYGTFAAQVGYAQSLQMYDSYSYKSIFLDGIASVLNGVKAITVLKEMEGDIQALIPATGLKPVVLTTK